MLTYDFYAPWYDIQNQLEDLEFYLEALDTYGSPVLEVGCGTGRLLIPFAREGFQVTGIDTSRAMLQIARKKMEQESDEIRKRITLTFADMREFQLLPLFKVAVLGCNTFQHLLTNPEQDQTLSCIYRHLEPDGRLFLQSTHMHFWDHDPDVLYHRGREYHPETQHLIDVFYSYHYDYLQQLQHLHLYLDILDEQEHITRKKIQLTFRYFYPPELERILNMNGFEIEEIYGDFLKNPLTNSSVWMIIQARKKPL